MNGTSGALLLSRTPSTHLQLQQLYGPCIHRPKHALTCMARISASTCTGGSARRCATSEAQSPARAHACSSRTSWLCSAAAPVLSTRPAGGRRRCAPLPAASAAPSCARPSSPSASEPPSLPPSSASSSPSPQAAAARAASAASAAGSAAPPSPPCWPSAAPKSNTGLRPASTPASVGRKKGAAAGFFGGSIGLLRACRGERAGGVAIKSKRTSHEDAWGREEPQLLLAAPERSAPGCPWQQPTRPS